KDGSKPVADSLCVLAILLGNGGFLTGLLNRRGFFEDAGSLIAISRRNRMAPVSVLVFDLDHFKAVNDRSGHATGDAMLQLFAKVARETLRATDIIGRLGGGEIAT